MIHPHRFLFLAFIILLPALGKAEDPVIVIDKSTLTNIFIEPITGPNGPDATAVLQNDLTRGGNFRIDQTRTAPFTVKASFTAPGTLSATLLRRGITPIFNRTFTDPDWRRATHLLADAITTAVTGEPGIASARVVFISAHTGHKEVYLMDIDGANVRQLTNDSTISLGPSFSYDGRRIVYTSYKNRYPDVWLIDLIESTKKPIATFPGLNANPSFAPDGERIALTLSKDGNAEIYTLLTDGTSPTRLTRTRGTEASPIWSPDGNRIAYVSDDRGSAQIYTMTPMGAERRRIRTNTLYATDPDWSSDGEQIAYTIRVAGQFQIATTHLSSGKQQILTSGGSHESPSWCPNSRHLLFSKDGQIFLFDSRTQKAVHIDNNLSKNSQPDCSK